MVILLLRKMASSSFPRMASTTSAITACGISLVALDFRMPGESRYVEAPGFREFPAPLTGGDAAASSPTPTARKE